MDGTTLTAAELAKKLEVTKAAIYEAVRKKRVQPTQDSPMRFRADTTLPAPALPRVSDEVRQRVAALRVDGHTQTQIAQAVGCSQKTVSRILRIVTD